MYEILNTLAEYVNYILAYFYSITGNYGLSIIMLTAVVNIVTFPLTRKQLQSSRKLQEVQPELKKIQDKYKHDREKSNKATMEFMREHQVNPLGGCLPLLVQFPIIIAVFTLLREPWRFMDIEVINTTFLFLDLTTSPSEAAPEIIFLNPYLILPIMAAAATYFHQKLVLTDPRQKIMLYIFPVMILGISYSFPAGLVLYWFTNSLLSVGNHFVIKTTEKASKSAKTESEKQEKDKGAAKKPVAEQQEEPETADRVEPRETKENLKKKKGKTGSTGAPKAKKKSLKGKKKGAGKAK